MVLMNFFMPFFFFSIMFANSRMISGFCAPFFMREIMGELGTPVILLSQIIKTTKGTNQFECGAQRHRLCKGRSLFLFLPPHPLFPPIFICSFPLPRGGQAGRWPVQKCFPLQPSPAGGTAAWWKLSLRWVGLLSKLWTVTAEDQKGQADRQTDRQIDRQTDGQRGRVEKCSNWCLLFSTCLFGFTCLVRS